MAKPELDTDKLDDAALAILSLTLHDGNRVWKGIDWSITDRLHAKGLIHDPIGKAKSCSAQRSCPRSRNEDDPKTEGSRHGSVALSA